jgi:hypothetical protein
MMEEGKDLGKGAGIIWKLVPSACVLFMTGFVHC